MFATKRTFSNLEAANRLDFGNSTRFQSSYEPCKLFSNASSRPHKRIQQTPSSQPEIYSWSRSRGDTADVQGRLGAPAVTSSPAFNFLPNDCIYGNGKEGGSNEVEGDFFSSNAFVYSFGQDMSGKRPGPPSYKGKEKSIDVSSYDEPICTKSACTRSNSSRSSNPVRGGSSRRRPVPGVNRPYLAATGRETTSLKGTENPFRLRNQVDLNDGGGSTSTVLSSGLSSFNFGPDDSPFAPDELRPLYSMQLFPSWDTGSLAASSTTHSSNSEIFGIDPSHVSFESKHWDQIPVTDFETSNDQLLSSVWNPLNAQLNEIRQVNYSQWEQDLESGIFDEYYLQGTPQSGSTGASILSPNFHLGQELTDLNFDFVSSTPTSISPSTTGQLADHDRFDTVFSFVPDRFAGNILPTQNLWATEGLKNQEASSVESQADHYNGPESNLIGPENLDSESSSSALVTDENLARAYSETLGEPSALYKLAEVRYDSSNNEDSKTLDQMPDQMFGGQQDDSPSQSNLLDTRNQSCPLMVLVEDTNETQPKVQEILAKANQQSRSRKAGQPPNSPMRKIATTWEHVFVKPMDFTEARNDSSPERGSQKLGRRRSPLKHEVRQRAKEVRKLRACKRCRALKISCTTDDICKGCQRYTSSQKYTSSPLLPVTICTRAHLRDYLGLFLPERAVRPFQKGALEKLMASKVAGLGGSPHQIMLSSDFSYPPISINVQVFRVNPEFSYFKKLRLDSRNKEPVFVEVPCPPLGITDFSQDLRSKLRKHIQGIIQSERNYGEVLYGNTSQLTWDVLEVVKVYQRENYTNELLRKAMMLYAMQYFMTKAVAMLRDESEDIQELPRPIEIDCRKANMRIINIQVKHVMLSLIQDTYASVLEGLEENLVQKRTELWAPTVCCILILCMCAEMVQITSDLRVVNALDDISKSPDGLDKNGNTASRDDSIEVSQLLDDVPIRSIESSFHTLYRMTKVKSQSRVERGFNPIRDGLGSVENAELGQDVERFVGGILNVVADHRDKLKPEATKLSFNTAKDNLEDHQIFRKHNNGRLVSRFLQSLL